MQCTKLLHGDESSLIHHAIIVPLIDFVFIA